MLDGSELSAISGAQFQRMTQFSVSAEGGISAHLLWSMYYY